MNSDCANVENVENNEPSQVPSDQLSVEQANNEVVEMEPTPQQQQNDENITNTELDLSENGHKNTSIEQIGIANEPVDTNETNDTEQPTDAPNTKEPDNSNGPDAETETKDNENDDGHDDNGDALVKLREEEEPIDPSQCRICLSKDNLLDIFTVDTKTHFRICDLIMKLCATVKISERDYLPHYVCNGCIQRIDLAWELRTQCEETEKFLRSKLKRSKKTTRRAPSEFLLISAIDSSSESEDGDNKSEDEEFKLSEQESEQSSESSDSDVSFQEKKKPLQRRRRPPPPRSVPAKRNVTMPIHQPVKQSRFGDVVRIPAMTSDDDKPLVRRAGPLKKPTKVVSVFKCDICNRFCSTAEALQQHRRTHADEKCPICAKVFRPRSLLLQHIQKHKDDSDRVCGTCHKVFPTINDCKRHMQTAHSQSMSCNKCKRSFSSKARLDAHKCNDDAGTKRKYDGDHSMNTGRDLFKSVAPLTTTYWSDSFSD